MQQDGLACIAPAISSLVRWSHPRPVYVSIGNTLFIAGVIVVTMEVKLPLNGQLAVRRTAIAAAHAVGPALCRFGRPGITVRATPAFAAMEPLAMGPRSWN